jgi:hypothetical protein
MCNSMRYSLNIYLNTVNNIYREGTKCTQNVIQKINSVRNDLDCLGIVQIIILKWLLKRKV